jgi:HK97 family phage major capsid protein
MDNPNPQLAAAISAELAKHFGKVQEVITKTEQDLRQYKEIQDGTKQAVADLNTSGQKIIADLAKQKADADARLLDIEQKLAVKADKPANQEEKSIGRQLIESEDFKSFAAEAQGTSQNMRMKNRFQVKGIKGVTIVSTVGSAGAGIFPQFLPTPVIPNFQPLTIRDLLGSGTTNSNSIFWVQESVFVNNAGYQGSDGNLKPQSTINYIQQNIAVETIGHWFRVSKQALSDFPMLETLINNRATFGLKFAEEQELLYGSGAAGHIHGLTSQATVYNGGFATNDTKIDTVRKAMLQAALAFYPSTGIALSPGDWADIQLTKDSQHRYIWANPLQMGPGMLWGLPVAECFSMQRGDFLVGALKLAATVFDRQEASILLSTEDQDNVVRNLVTILAEERLALAVSRPQAIIYGDFQSGQTGL